MRLRKNEHPAEKGFMKGLLALFISLGLLQAGQPLHVACVVRQGLPPYEEESQKFYRLEGDGCESLNIGELISLARPAEKRRIGRLKVTVVKGSYALAIVESPGETFPLRGDLVVRQEKLLQLPALPEPTAEVLATDVGVHEPQVPEEVKRLPSMSAAEVAASKREPIYFLKDDAHLSPGALRKLAGWVEAWGKEGLWFLAFPAQPSPSSELCRSRAEALKTELKQLGVERVEEHVLPTTEPGPYQAVYVGKAQKNSGS